MSKFREGEHVMVIGQPGWLEGYEVNVPGIVYSDSNGPSVMVSVARRLRFSYHLDAVAKLDPNEQMFYDWKGGVP
jgi:hypothetical protein